MSQRTTVLTDNQVLYLLGSIVAVPLFAGFSLIWMWT